MNLKMHPECEPYYLQSIALLQKNGASWKFAEDKRMPYHVTASKNYCLKR